MKVMLRSFVVVVPAGAGEREQCDGQREREQREETPSTRHAETSSQSGRASTAMPWALHAVPRDWARIPQRYGGRYTPVEDSCQNSTRRSI